MSLQPLHDVRSTPIKGHRGGRRAGAGRPLQENRNPNWAEDLSEASQLRADDKKERAEYLQQQEELVNPTGRS
jgi:hypothetical protein